MYYQGTSNCADQTEQEFPYLEFLKRPDLHRLAYDGREARTGCGPVWFNRTQVTGRERFRFYSNGDCTFALMGKSGIIHGMHFEAGDLLFLPPKMELEGSYAAGPEMNVSLHHDTLQGLTSQSFPRVPAIFQKSDSDALIASINRFVEFEEGDPISLCLALLPNKPEQLVTPARRRLASEIRDLLDAHLEEVCIADVCRCVGVSIRGAEIAFRAEFTETMRQYVRRNRLERARCLLLEGWSVSQAAQEVGWGHLGRFSAAFGKQYGVLPSGLSLAV